LLVGRTRAVDDGDAFAVERSGQVLGVSQQVGAADVRRDEQQPLVRAGRKQ